MRKLYIIGVWLAVLMTYGYADDKPQQVAQQTPVAPRTLILPALQNGVEINRLRILPNQGIFARTKANDDGSVDVTLYVDQVEQEKK